MTFDEILDQVVQLLQRQGRVSYRALKRRFNLDDEYLEDLKAELIKAQRLAVDEDGEVLVWTGGPGESPAPGGDEEHVPRAIQAAPPGAQQADHALPIDRSPAPRGISEAERRQLTVLFCDLVDSTGLASQLDPEELREVVRAYQDTCAKVIARFEGHIAQYLGDGLLVYFGYPLAHEDDAQRGVRAGLGIVEAMGQLNSRLSQEHGVTLAVRLGIHTGLVVVGEVGGGTRHEQLALGETPNLAARLQGIAAPNTLVISAATFQLLGGFFACQSLGMPLLKGFAQPLEVYQVLSESTARSRLEAVGRTSLTPLVGREAEVALLLERWAQVKEGLGQVVLLSGEAGIGKSRLVQVLKEHVAAEPQAWLTPCQCSPYYQNTALYPMIELLERVALQFEREELPQQKLRKLEGFVVQYGLPPQATYVFKHALIQEAAYQSLLRSTRQQHHQRIAQVLETRFPGTVDTQPELLAHHYTEAGLSAQAIPYWQRAGQRAIQRSANVEATNHLTKGLEVLKALPYTLELTREELELQTALGLSLIAIKGYGAPEVEEAYIRARQLCQQVGENPPLFPVLRGLWNCYLVRAELQTARDLGKELLSLAQRLEDSALLVEVYRALGTTLLFLGDLASARAHLEQGMALYDPQQHRSLAFRYGADPGVICQLYAAWTLWLLGYPDQALQRIHDALTLTYELAHAFSLAFALNHAAVVHMLRREERATQEQAEASITFSTEQRIAQWLAQGVTLRGWALAAQGQGEEGIVQIRQGLAAWRATGAELTRPYWLALLADAYGKGRRAEEGLQVLAEALAAVKNRGECWCEAELYRLKGELLLRHAPEHDMEAETCFRQALDIARRQQAKSWELRAAMSLARLWQRPGKRAEARELLAPIYGWFTEGFDTADLQEAKALLDTFA